MPRSCQVTSAGPLMSGGRQNTSWPRHAAGSHSEDQAAGRAQNDTQVIVAARPPDQDRRTSESDAYSYGFGTWYDCSVQIIDTDPHTRCSSRTSPILAAYQVSSTKPHAKDRSDPK